MKRILMLIAVFFMVWPVVRANGPLQVKFRSRALLDATVSGYGKEKAQGYYRIEDFRVGFKATYRRFKVKADVGIGDGKLVFKDLVLGYRFRNGVLSFGNSYEPFSMDILISAANLRFHQSAASVLAFSDSRKLGATYHFYNARWYLGTGIYTHNDLNEIGDGQRNAFVSTSRAVWRRQGSDHRMLHFGGAFSFRTQEVNTPEAPTGEIGCVGITSMFPAPLLGAEISDKGSEVKGVMEALLTAPRFMLQAEYCFDRFGRTGGKHAFCPHGGYIQGGFLVKGRGFGYDSVYGIPGRPVSSQAIELVARFNYTDLNDGKAQIRGGEEKDLSLGINFYLNEYFGVKVNGGYVWVGRHCNSFYQEDFFLVQARMQYIF